MSKTCLAAIANRGLPGDDPAAGLEDHLVGLDGVGEVFEFGGKAGTLLAALLGDAEVAEDVAAGVAHQAGEVDQEVGSFGRSDSVL
jgi:hypothetical protein